MYSTYLFLAFIFGRTLLVESTFDGVTIAEVAAKTTTNEIGFKLSETGTKITTSTLVQVFPTGTPAEDGKEVTEYAAPIKTDTEYGTATGELEAGKQYDFYITNDKTAYSELLGTLATKPEPPAVTFDSAGSTSAKYKWTNYKTDYETGKASAVLDPAVDTFTAKEEELELTGLTASTKYDITFTGEKFGQTNTLEKSLCTAPSKLTVTTEVKTEDNGDNTLTVNIAFGEKDKVSKIDIELGVDISDAGITAACDITCTDCKACSGAATKKTGNKGFEVTTAITDVGPKYSVIISKYPKANLETAFKVTAEFDDDCQNQGTIDNLSFATLANKETMLVYLAIGSMATVLRLLGLEVWTPLGSH